MELMNIFFWCLTGGLPVTSDRPVEEIEEGEFTEVDRMGRGVTSEIGTRLRFVDGELIDDGWAILKMYGNNIVSHLNQACGALLASCLRQNMNHDNTLKQP